MSQHNPTLVAFDSQNQALEWKALGDKVMGGRSDGTVVSSDEGHGCFYGTVRLDNGGGFASAKADLPNKVDASRYTGVEFFARGDGKTYKVGLRNSTNRNSVVYQQNFTPDADSWDRIRLPFSDFVPTWRGRILEDVATLDPGDIASLSLFVSGRQVGEFELWMRNWFLY